VPRDWRIFAWMGLILGSVYMAVAIFTMSQGPYTIEGHYRIAEAQSSVSLRAADASSIAAMLDGSDTGIVPALSGLRLVGWSTREASSTAKACTLKLFNGTANTDPLIGVIELATNASGAEWFPGGVRCPDGIYIEQLTAGGSADVIIYYDR